MTIYWHALFWQYVIATLALAILGVAAPPSMAQLNPDATLGAESSFVTPNAVVRGALADRIDGGAERDSNLFHSFDAFGVEFDKRVYFFNPPNVENILTRVTGNSSSDIYGTLGVDGNANLFLINPNGILFGPNVQLDINGSFTASTADSILFADGSGFSAINSGSASLLSVNTPNGVQYGSNTSVAITNEGTLTVGQDISLLGAGPIFLFGDITTSNGSGVAGDITLFSQNSSISFSGNEINADSNNNGAGFTTITIEAPQGSVTLDDAIVSTDNNNGSRFAGDIIIGAGNEIQLRGSTISSNGLFGRILIGSNDVAPSIASPRNITITNSNITSTDARSFDPSNQDFRAGDIFIGAENNIQLSNSKISTNGNNGRIFIGPNNDELTIVSPQNITITNNSQITSTETRGSTPSNDVVFRAGDIFIGVENNIQLSNNSEISTNGNNGRIFIGPNSVDPNIALPQRIIITDANISSQHDIDGRSGTISLQANQLIEIDEGTIATENFKTSEGGNISLETLHADSRIILRNASGIFNDTRSDMNAGSTEITTNQLSMSDGSTVQSVSWGVQGNGGDITIDAASITLSGMDDDTSTGIFVNVLRPNLGDVPPNSADIVDIVNQNLAGSAGNITIRSSGDLNIVDGATINVGAFPSNEDLAMPGLGEAGNVTVVAGRIHLDNGIITAIARAGDQADINIFLTGALLLLDNRSLISAGAEDEGGGGDLNIFAENGFILAYPSKDSDILANAVAGPGGDIDITTNGIFGLEERDPRTDFSDINAASDFNLDGTVVLDTLNIDPTRGLGELPIDIVDASNLVAEGCVGSGRRDTDTQGEFTRTGRSGLSSDPTGVLTDESLLNDNQFALPNEDNLTDTSTNPALGFETLSDPEALVEAQGLAVNNNGNVSLAVSADIPSYTSSLVSSPDACDVQ